MNTQQAAATSQANNALKNGKRVPPFRMLFPIIEPLLDKDKTMKLRTIYNRLKKNEISNDGFVKQMRRLVGDHVLKQAVVKLKEEAPLSSQVAQTQVASHSQVPAQQQHMKMPAVGSKQFSESHSFAQLNQKGPNSSVNPSGPSLAIRAPADSSNTAMDNNSHILHDIKQEREPPIPIQGLNKQQQQQQQQQHMHFSQSAFPSYVTTGSNYNQYAGGNMQSSMQSPKLQPQNMQARQVPIHPGVTGNLSNDSIGMQQSRTWFSTSTSIMQSNAGLSPITTQMDSSNSAFRSSQTAPNQVASNVQFPAQQQHMNSSPQSLKQQPQNIHVKLQAEMEELKKEKADLENRLKVALSEVEGFLAQKSSWDKERNILGDKVKNWIARAVKAESSNSELTLKLQTCEAIYKAKVEEELQSVHNTELKKLQLELEEVRPDFVKIMDEAVCSFQDGYSTCVDKSAASGVDVTRKPFEE